MSCHVAVVLLWTLMGATTILVSYFVYAIIQACSGVIVGVVRRQYVAGSVYGNADALGDRQRLLLARVYGIRWKHVWMACVNNLLEQYKCSADEATVLASFAIEVRVLVWWWGCGTLPAVIPFQG